MRKRLGLVVDGQTVEVEVRSEAELADSGMVIVAARVVDADDAVVAGAVVTPCSQCGYDVWISPSSKRIQATGGNPVWCMQCVVKQVQAETPEAPSLH